MITSQPGEPSAVAFPIAIEGPFAGLIADLQSIVGDLEFAHHMAGTTIAIMTSASEPVQDQQAILRGLWSAALISYRRAFAVGKSHAVPSASRFDIQGLREHVLTDKQKEADKTLREYIDKHVAHRVVDLEQIKLLVLLNPPPNPRGIIGLGPVSLFGIAPSESVMGQLQEICGVLISQIKPQIDKLLEDARVDWETNDETLEAMYKQWAIQNPNFSPGS